MARRHPIYERRRMVATDNAGHKLKNRPTPLAPLNRGAPEHYRSASELAAPTLSQSLKRALKETQKVMRQRLAEQARLARLAEATGDTALTTEAPEEHPDA